MHTIWLAVLLYADTHSFRASGEVVAEIEMSSPGADWSKPGREAALATLTVDGGRAQHVMLYAGVERHTYRVLLGELFPGDHTLRVARHAEYSAPKAALEVHAARFRSIPKDDPAFDVVAHAPILFARANTVGAFTDIPLVSYCERLTEAGETVLQYTVIFSNEDGGTSTSALMARWGRTTDIEYIYRYWPRSGKATMQAKDHKEVEFRGRREGSHPVLIPSTQNNMVADEGESPIRYQLAPVLVDLARRTRESVMDDAPVTWRVMVQELEREGKLRPFGGPGDKIGDPRQYLYIDAKVANEHSATAFLVRLRSSGEWYASHAGRPDWAITRSGWIRTTIELPPGTRPEDVVEFGFECLVANEKPPPVSGRCRVEEAPRFFFFGGASFFRLARPVEITAGRIQVVGR